MLAAARLSVAGTAAAKLSVDAARRPRAVSPPALFSPAGQRRLGSPNSSSRRAVGVGAQSAGRDLAQRLKRRVGGRGAPHAHGAQEAPSCDVVICSWPRGISRRDPSFDLHIVCVYPAMPKPCSASSNAMGVHFASSRRRRWAARGARRAGRRPVMAGCRPMKSPKLRLGKVGTRAGAGARTRPSRPSTALEGVGGAGAGVERAAHVGGVGRRAPAQLLRRPRAGRATPFQVVPEEHLSRKG